MSEWVSAIGRLDECFSVKLTSIRNQMQMQIIWCYEAEERKVNRCLSKHVSISF